MGVNRLEFVKDLCKSLNKELPANDDIPMTSISTDLRAFVLALPDVAETPKKTYSSKKKEVVIENASEEKSEE